MTDADDNETRYELVMPFVLTQSHGGPFEDKAFVAGWQLGELSVRLKLAAALGEVPPGVYLERELQPQIDLLAMKNGFSVATIELDEEDDANGLFWGYAFSQMSEEF